MQNSGDRNNGAMFLGVGATILAAVSLIRNKAVAAPSTVVGLSKDVMDLLSAMAEGVAAILSKLDQILAAVKSGGGGTGGQGYPSNADRIIVQQVNCPQIQPQSYPLPDIVVADGLTVLIEAPTTNARAVYIGGSQTDAGQTTRSKPLIPGQNVAIPIKNTKDLYVGALQAGDMIIITAPQRNS